MEEVAGINFTAGGWPWLKAVRNIQVNEANKREGFIDSGLRLRGIV
jgi:hypothetical protein